MKQEELVNKGVEKHFNGQEVLFKVSSLNEHFEGLQIHESDIISIEDVDFVKVGDVNFDNATANEVEPKGDIEEVEEVLTEQTEDFPVWVNPEIEVVDPIIELPALEVAKTKKGK